MRTAFLLLAATCCGNLSWSAEGNRQAAPLYTPSSILNAATNASGALSPNAIGVVYGQGLAYTTKSLAAGDLRDGSMPTILPGTGLRVLIGNVPAHLYHVSPTQVNFLVPANLRPGLVDFQLVLDGKAGPAVQIPIGRTSPGLFQQESGAAVVARADGSLATRTARARPGENVVLYATGLGDTVPPLTYGRVAKDAARIAAAQEFQVLLNGHPVDPALVAYVGVTPGFGGLYQINLRIPEGTKEDPEVRLVIGDAASPAGVILPLRTE